MTETKDGPALVERPQQPPSLDDYRGASEEEIAALPPRDRKLVHADRAAERVEALATVGWLTSELASEISIVEFDKSEWGDGPWKSEPDLVMWRAGPPSRYRCQVSRNGFGSLNGYVAVPSGHPAFGLDYGDERVRRLATHRGLTFAGPATGDHWVFGFDCGHAFDIQPAHEMRLRRCGLLPFREQAAALGFELAFGDDADSPFVDRYRDLAYVRQVVELLAVQLSAVATHGWEAVIAAIDGDDDDDGPRELAP